MRAEYLIGLEIVCFLLGYFIRDLKDLGAAPRRKRRGANPVSARRAAPKNPRTPW